ncbi:MAG: DUF222 domain-containing protein [Streptosporangiaceae bacterium]
MTAAVAWRRHLLEAAIAARVDHVDADKAVKAFGYGSTSTWLRQACRMRSGRAAERVVVARQLRRLPEVAKKFAAGDLARGRGGALCTDTCHLPHPKTRHPAASAITTFPDSDNDGSHDPHPGRSPP